MKSNCNSIHIGQTSIPLTIRIKEHRASDDKMDGKSAISEHVKGNPHLQINGEGARPLSLSENHGKRINSWKPDK